MKMPAKPVHTNRNISGDMSISVGRLLAMDLSLLNMDILWAILLSSFDCQRVTTFSFLCLFCGTMLIQLMGQAFFSFKFGASLSSINALYGYLLDRTLRFSK
jgi:hypothetical protein